MVTSATIVSIAITPANPIVTQGQTQQFTVTGTFSDHSTQDLTTSATWSSSAPTVATISNVAGSKGSAAAVGSGITMIGAAFGSVTSSTVMTVPVAGGGSGALNVISITVDGSLCAAQSGPAIYPNKPCVSVTVCTPGTSSCQTITDILLDTGSYGLRLFKSVLNNLPLQQATTPSGALAECSQFLDGTTLWGPVQIADVHLGGEPVITVPIQVIDATFGTVPTSCGTPATSPSGPRYNGVLGVGLFAADCGAGCAIGRGNGVYYACNGSSCTGTTVTLTSQVQNPVAHLPLDNNGVLVQLPSVPPGGGPSSNGQLVFGIGTRANNIPAGVTTYPANQVGEFTTIFNGTAYTNSFIDSGSNGLFLSDSALPVCTGWYCPPATVSLSAVTEGASGFPGSSVPFQIGNATGLFNSGNKVFAELGGTSPAGSGFDWGMPFFYGRNVFVGIQSYTGLPLTPTGLGNPPFWAY
jgi:hypothetical protein